MGFFPLHLGLYHCNVCGIDFCTTFSSIPHHVFPLNLAVSRACGTSKQPTSLGGLEPPTFRLTAERANRLRHRDLTRRAFHASTAQNKGKSKQTSLLKRAFGWAGNQPPFVRISVMALVAQQSLADIMTTTPEQGLEPWTLRLKV